MEKEMLQKMLDEDDYIVNNLSSEREYRIFDKLKNHLVNEALSKYKIGDVIEDNWVKSNRTVERLEGFKYRYGALSTLTKNNSTITLFLNGKWAQIIKTEGISKIKNIK